MITASLLFWVPGLVVHSALYLCSDCVPLPVYHIFTMFRLADSLANPIIYSFRIPMFMETFKRVKLCKHSKKYEINYTPWKCYELLRLVARRSLFFLSAVCMKIWASCIANHQALLSQIQKTPGDEAASLPRTEANITVFGKLQKEF